MLVLNRRYRYLGTVSSKNMLQSVFIDFTKTFLKHPMNEKCQYRASVCDHLNSRNILLKHLMNAY